MASKRPRCDLRLAGLHTSTLLLTNTVCADNNLRRVALSARVLSFGNCSKDSCGKDLKKSVPCGVCFMEQLKYCMLQI